MSDEEPRIVKDAPRMRSMQIKPLASSMLMVPPRTSSIPQKRAPIAEQHTKVSTAKVCHTQGDWNLEALESVPPIYALERTHIHVKDSVANIAGRVRDCLRSNSMSAAFYSKEVAADVETADNVQLVIRLWESGKLKPGHVLIETQKVAGDGRSYMQAARSILRAAKCMDQSMSAPATQPTMRATMVPPMAAPDSSNQKEKDADLQEGLSIAADLLAQDRVDTRVLAWESLKQLSGASSDYDCVVARRVLTGQGEILSFILALINREVADEKDFLCVMRRNALVVFSNCLKSLERADTLKATVASNKSIVSREVVTALGGELSAALERPHEACLAAECLRPILKVASTNELAAMQSGGLLSIAQECGVLEFLSQAQQIGANKHSDLEGACTKCLATLSA